MANGSKSIQGERERNSAGIEIAHFELNRRAIEFQCFSRVSAAVVFQNLEFGYFLDVFRCASGALFGSGPRS